MSCVITFFARSCSCIININWSWTKRSFFAWNLFLLFLPNYHAFIGSPFTARSGVVLHNIRLTEEHSTSSIKQSFDRIVYYCSYCAITCNLIWVTRKGSDAHARQYFFRVIWKTITMFIWNKTEIYIVIVELSSDDKREL